MTIWKKKNNTEGSDDGDEQKFITIERPSLDSTPQGNRIYFYTDITAETILALNKQIDDVTKQLKIAQITYNLAEPPPIELHICSDGGDVCAAMASVDKIISNSVPIHTYCEGSVASAGTLLSVVAPKRFISRNACMLIHQVSSGLWGNYMEFKDEVKNLDLIMTLIRSVYLKKSKFKPKQLDKILSRDLFLSSEECLKHGLVDQIL